MKRRGFPDMAPGGGRRLRYPDRGAPHECVRPTLQDNTRSEQGEHAPLRCKTVRGTSKAFAYGQKA